MKQRTKRRLIAFLMVFALVVTTVLTDVPFLSRAESGTLEVKDVSIEINGNTPTDDTIIKNGDNVRINFTWALDNNDRTNSQFVVDISPLVNVTLTDLATTSLFSGSTYVGTVNVTDGKLYIDITNQDFLAQYERNGGGTIYGLVNVSGTPTNGSDYTIGIGDYSNSFTYNDGTVPSKLSVSKWGQGSLQYVGDKWLQTFRVNLKADGNVSNISVSDVFGSGELSNMSVLKVVESNVDGIAVDSKYTNFDALTSGLTMVKDGNITVEYTVEVSANVFDNNTVGSDYANTVKATYKDDKGNDKNTDEVTAGINVSKPSVGKNGVVNNDGTVTWTVTINLNDYAKTGKSFSELVTSIKDTPGTGFVGAGVPVDLFTDPALWTDKGNGKYTYTYTTTLTDDYKNSASSVQVRNDIAFTTVDGETYTGSGSVNTIPVAWDFTKTCEGETDGVISWKVVTNIPTGLTNVCIKDDTSNYYTGNEFTPGSHSLQGDIYVKDTLVIDDGAIAAGATDIVESYDVWNGIKFKDGVFGTTFINPVTITYNTVIGDADKEQKEYKNKATITYTSNGLNGSKDSTAVYQVEENKIDEALSKTGEVKVAGSSIEYKLKLNLNYLNLTAGDVGKNVTITDTLPNNMKYDSVSETAFYLTDLWGNTWKMTDSELSSAGISQVEPVTPSVSGGVLTINIPITEDMVDLVADAKSKTQNASVVITYVTEVDDKQAFAAAGTTNFKNSAEGEYDGETMGPVVDETTLTPSPVVTKTGNYPVAKIVLVDGHECKEYVAEYTVVVNPNELDLSTGKLIATDTLGDALAYDLKTIKVYDDTNDVYLTMGNGANQYSYTYDYAGNSITFTLPDSLSLRITYQCTVSLYAGNGKLTPENSFNKFSLGGYASDATEDEVSFDKNVTKADFWAESLTGSITIKKFWTNDGTMVALSGCRFNLYEAEYNTSTGKLELGATPVRSNMQITDDVNGEYEIKNLEPDQIYALVEISSGSTDFLTNKDIYYFVIPGANGITLPDGYEIRNFAFGNTIDYENYEAGKLVITKTLAGDVTKEEAEGLLQFKVTNTDTGEVLGTYTLKNDFVYDAVNEIWTKTFTDIPVGNYSVEETVYDITGYVCDSVTYQIDGGAIENGTKADVAVDAASSGGATVAFEDTYSVLTQPIELQLYLHKINENGKNIGGVEFEISDGSSVVDTIVSDPSGAVKSGYTGWQKDVLYTMTETVTPAQYQALSGPIKFYFAESGSVVLTEAPDGVSVVAHETETIATQIEVVNEHVLTEVSGIKVWEDNNNQDGKRPTEITVQLQYYDTATSLWKNVTPAKTAVVKATDIPAWSYAFNDLRQFDDNGNEIQYRVVELNVPTGYSVEGGEFADGYNLTNTYTTETTSVHIEKVWEDNNNQDGKRPNNITVQLFADGVQIGERTIDASNGWELNITGLPKYKNGELIKYTLTESTISNYTTEIIATEPTATTDVDITITNTHTPAVREIEATKAWVTGADPNPPTEATFELFADGVSKGKKTVTAATSWKAVWSDLPVYKNGGQEIVYTVTEDTIPKYIPTYGPLTDGKITITNTYNPTLTNMTVTKVWSDADNQDSKRPTSIEVQLYKNGVAEGAAVTLPHNGNWTYTWENLDSSFTYTVQETSVLPAGYTKTEVKTSDTNTIITNSYTPETTYINVKKNWVNDNKTDSQRPNVIVELLANDVSTGKTLTLTAANGWSGKFSGLPKYEKGNLTPIVYKIIEKNVPLGYTVTGGDTLTGDNFLIITNTFPATSRTVRKVWDDYNNQDGLRPTELWVDILADGVSYDRVKLDAVNNWTYKWDSLPLYDNGHLIVWSIKEDAVAGYTASAPTSENVVYEDSIIKDLTFVLKNSYVPELTSLTVDKKWLDNNNQDGKRPGSITIQLYANGTPVSGRSAVLSASNTWKVTFSDLPAKSGGVAIDYTVRELAVTDYTDTYEKDASGNITITNTHTPGKVTHSVFKVWNDNNNQDGLRPASIEVQLYADGVAYGTPVVLNVANNWSYQWIDLDEMKAGVKIAYTVKETTVPSGYIASTVDDVTTCTTTITNTHTPAVRNFSVSKVWDDNNNAAGLRTNEITVQLYANGVAYGTPIVLSAVNTWSHSWNNLPAKSAGTDIVYTVQEVNTPSGYTSLQSTSGASITTITNKLVTETDEPDEPTTAEETTEEESEEETTEEESEDETTEEEETEEDSDMDGDSEDDGDVETDDDGPAPNTGDKAMPFAMALLMVLSVLGIVALTVFGRKRKM